MTMASLFGERIVFWLTFRFEYQIEKRKHDKRLIRPPDESNDDVVFISALSMIEPLFSFTSGSNDTIL